MKRPHGLLRVHGGGTSETEERVREATDAAAAKDNGGLGSPGRAMSRRHPFFIGMAGAAGVAVTYFLVELVIKSRSVLVLIGLALFLAAGLDPVVRWLTGKGVPRWAAVLIVLLGLLAVVAGFIAAAVPPLASQTSALIHELPHYMHQLQNRNSQIGRLNAKYHIQQRITSLLSSRGTALIGGVIGAGALVISAFSGCPASHPAPARTSLSTSSVDTQ